MRGTAINMSLRPMRWHILLEGSAHAQPGFAGKSGLVYGNILLSTDDDVIVQNGKTCFNGVINQPYIAGTGSETEPGDARVFGAITTAKAYPLTAPFLPNLFTAAGGIDPYVAAVAIGHLTVAAGGTLDLVNDPRQGAAGAYVSTYFQAAGGELELEIRGIADGPGASQSGWRQHDRQDRGGRHGHLGRQARDHPLRWSLHQCCLSHRLCRAHCRHLDGWRQCPHQQRVVEGERQQQRNDCHP